MVVGRDSIFFSSVAGLKLAQGTFALITDLFFCFLRNIYFYFMHMDAFACVLASFMST